MSDDELTHSVALAEQALRSAASGVLIFALDPLARDKLDAKDIAQVITWLEDALVLKSRKDAA